MTADKYTPIEEKNTQLLEEICESTRAIRRVTNRILDHLHELYTGSADSYEDSDEWNWDQLDESDDMYL